MLKSKRFNLGEKAAPYVLLAPFLFTLIIFFGYALVRVTYFSFTDYDLFSAPRWVWFKNYINLFKEVQFMRALKNSLSFAIIVTSCQTCIALLLAVTLNQKMKGIKFFRAAYYMPSVTSSVVITLIFMWVFQKRGFINFLIFKMQEYSRVLLLFVVLAASMHILLVLSEKFRKRPVSAFEPCFLVLSFMVAGGLTFIATKIGLVNMLTDVKPVETVWLNTRQNVVNWAGPFAFSRPLFSIMLLNIWTTAPTFMLLYLAGLQDIPRDVYEAAHVDGASPWHTFWYITVPQLSNITFLVVTMGLIGTLQMFDQVAIVGNQAPLDSTITLAYYVYISIFPSSAAPNVGLGSAAAIFLSCLTLIIVLIQKRIANK